jgi:ABC-2 type transport system ATP-binding protein
LLELLGLAGRERLRIRGYSKGMKQRLGLAQALLHRPSVLFLDEPTDGVDPVGRKQIRDLLLAERARGVTIFINSHLLGEVEQLCDRVAILKKGQLALVGTVPEVVGDRATTPGSRGDSSLPAPPASGGSRSIRPTASTAFSTRPAAVVSCCGTWSASAARWRRSICSWPMPAGHRHDGANRVPTA